MTAVEQVSSGNLIRNVSMQPAGFLKARVAGVNERRATDAGTVNRIYRIEISSLPAHFERADETSATVILDTVPKSKVGTRQVPFRIRWTDPVAAVPSHVRLLASSKGETPKARVMLVRRTSNPLTVRLGRFDASLIKVSKLANADTASIAYEISPAREFTRDATTSVTFDLGDDRSRQVVVAVDLAAGREPAKVRGNR